jgi:hypothetical protein
VPRKRNEPNEKRQRTDRCTATFSSIQSIERTGQSLNLGPQ